MQILNDSTLLTTSEANDVFGRVTSIDGDSSLTAFFRAITIKHNEGKPLDEIVRKASIYRDRTCNNEEVEYFMNTCSHSMMIVEITDKFASIDPHVDGWVTYDSAPFYLNRYLSQIIKTKVYVNVEEQRVIALVDKHITHVWVQAFESMLWGILTWYYPSKSDDVIAFFKKLAVGNKNVSEEEARQTLIDYVNDAASMFNFRDMRLHKLLDGIADATRQSQIVNQKSYVADVRRDIDSYTSMLRELYERLNGATVLLNSLENQSANNDDSMFVFFQSHKNLSIIEVNGAKIKYSVEGTLEFYDEDEAKRLFDNKDSWVSRNFHEQFLKYMRALLVEKRGIIRVDASFELSNMSLVSPLRGEHKIQTSMPNPHIYYHGCSGGNSAYYSQYAKSGDWDLGIEQSISATKNWNVGDVTVGNEMFQWFQYNSATPCIYVGDGSPIERVTNDMRLVSFHEFEAIVDKAKELEAKEGEEVNNG